MANGFTIRGRKYDFSGMKQNPKRGPDDGVRRF
jgi:hypothetical protein